MPDTIEREITIAAPVERVWDLLTQAEGLGQWFGDDGADIDLRPGGDLTLRWVAHGTVTGRVERVERPSVFAYRWWLQGLEHQEAASTLVEFTLRSEGDGTHVRVVESGFDSLGAYTDVAAKVKENGDGWAVVIGRLRDHVEQVTA